MTTATLKHVFERVGEAARASGVFGAVRVSERGVECEAKNAADRAWYRLDVQEGVLCVSLVTPGRYLSQSIEADLMNTGDSLSELLEEEMVDLGSEPVALAVEHYRSEDKLFTFRSRLPERADEGLLAKFAERALLGYEATFRRLGDMDAGGGDS